MNKIKIAVIFGFFSAFLIWAFVFWTLTPYLQLQAYADYRLDKNPDEILKSKFIFSPYNFAQPFLRKNLLTYMTYSGTSDPASWQLFGKAIDKMEEAAARGDFNPYDYVLLGLAYAEKGRISGNKVFFEKAEENYKKAIALSPKQQKLYYAYGGFLLNQKRIDDGYDVLKKAFDFDKEAPWSNFYLGLAEINLGAGHYQTALDHYEFFFEHYREDEIFINPDSQWVKSKEVYKKLLAYFYAKQDKERVLKIAERLASLDRAQSASFWRVIEIIKNTGILPVIEFEK